MNHPITTFIIVLLFSFHLYQNINGLHILNIKNKFLQRILSTFYHVNNFHFLQNCLSLYNLRFIELMTSSKEYAMMILFLTISNSVIWNIVREFMFIQFSIGFSGVLFGIITIYPQNYFFEFKINKYLYPYMMLMFMQIIVPNASFFGHLVGIISGYLYLWTCTSI